jgi:starch phosphorylase
MIKSENKKGRKKTAENETIESSEIKKHEEVDSEKEETENSEPLEKQTLPENNDSKDSDVIEIESKGKLETLIEKDTNIESGNRRSIKRRASLYKMYDMSENLFRPEFQLKKSPHDKNEKLWHLMDVYLPRDSNSIQKSVINHVEYTLARTRFDLDKHVLYQGTALSVRDRLLEAWNDTQINIKMTDPKRVYYLSIEFLLGRLLQNALVNIELEDRYKEALFDIGYKLEDIYDKENDPALGNGGLGRLAACYLDSMTALNYPAWGYGIRYDYGIFKQVIENFGQKEVPDYWLTRGNPWEIMRLDVKYKVRFGGYLKDEVRNGKKIRVWEGGEEVDAVAYDTVIPGWGTFNCNTLRLWKSFPSEEFDFDSFNKGDYSSALESKDHASYITSVLYPNDQTSVGKLLRLKQQYFFCSATIQDIIRRFHRSNLPWSEFPKKNAIQLNDTHPAVAVAELLHQLIDIYHLEYEEAFKIVNKTFAYTNHTVLPEALEKWSVELFSSLLPRHMELIYLINHYFLEEIRKRYPKDWEKHSRLSLIEESCPKMIRMANVCIVASHKVNGVAEIHSNLLKTHLFKDFYEIFPNKFTNVTNGVTPRRWVHCAFPELSALLTKYMEGDDWLGELNLLESLPDKLKDNGEYEEFLTKLSECKYQAKLRLANRLKEHHGIDISGHTDGYLFDVMVKRIHEYKRQFMNALYCIHRYLTIKSMSPEEKNKLVKRVTFFGGKAAPGYLVAKNVIKLINLIANTVNNDKDVNQFYNVHFVPDYKVSLAQNIIPAADLSQHISTAGTEASGTSNMKFAMTGSLIIGTRDGANIEIAKEIGEENIFFFGNDLPSVERLRAEMRYKKSDYVGNRLKRVLDSILNNQFGDTSFMRDYIYNMINGGDFYLVCHDFYQYLETQEKVDREFSNQRSWLEKCLHSICKMGFFSSDRAVETYAEQIWGVEPLQCPKPSSESSKHHISQGNLKTLNNTKNNK